MDTRPQAIEYRLDRNRMGDPQVGDTDPSRDDLSGLVLSEHLGANGAVCDPPGRWA
ncbi:hypothetical protein Pd630_LPD16096 (plasmid) [Rhodococcus opacus PD630]|nr:hypothetical protein Pd630_LPD16096 [Rhodococcus opacus PD630]